MPQRLSVTSVARLGGHTDPMAAQSRNAACKHYRARAAGAPSEMRLLIVDDHPLVRTSLTALLSNKDHFAVVGECQDGS